MDIKKWLVLAIILLSISIAFSGFFIGKSILMLTESKEWVPTMQKSNDDILSLSESAIYLKIPEEKLKSLVDISKLKDGKGIPYYKINNDILFSKTALSKWIVYVSESQFDY